ncbi:hypothetical protein [Candidatus Tokpelaia sp.]|uniref:VpaChn25_0724 family phage protein n=1 Tax=Candidatus Tokpelaia sp. TaxID=2233777 RepID=UPI001FEE7D56|nr:hypothetical protein [Candidatus Tokpelaia sp.]
MNYDDFLATDARLIILKELAQQPGHSANQTILLKVLDTFGHRRSREWVRQQMRYLADMNAVQMTEAGTVLIARLKQAGRDHLEHRIKLEGVDAPSEG